MAYDFLVLYVMSFLGLVSGLYIPNKTNLEMFPSSLFLKEYVTLVFFFP